MKTHLPHGLRVALMAALASVSITAFVGSSAQAATRLHSVEVESGEVLTLTYDVELVGVFHKSGGGTLQLANTTLVANADIDAGSVEFVNKGSNLPVINMKGGSFFLHNDASMTLHSITFSALSGQTGSITSTSTTLDFFNNGSATTLKNVVLTTTQKKALSVAMDNVSLVNTGGQDFFLRGSNITKSLVDVTTGGTLHIGAGEYGNGDTINATISGTANIGSIQGGANAALTVSGKVTAQNASALTKLTLSGGSFVVNSGNLNVTNLTIGEGNSSVSAQQASVQNLLGSGTLSKTGEGNMTVTDISSFTGTLDVQEGLLRVTGSNMGGFTKTGEGTLQMDAASLTGNLSISGGPVEFVDKKGQLATIKMQGHSFLLSDSGSMTLHSITFSALSGQTGSITSTSTTLDFFNNGSATTLKNVVLTTTQKKALSVAMDNVSLVNTGGQDFYMKGSNITKNLADVTTGGTLYIGAGESAYGNGDTINATISGTANIGSLAIGSKSTLTVKAGGKLYLDGAIATGVNKLTMASGSTLSVKEGDLFAAAAAPGSSYTLSGVTLEANEGNWTINKAIKVNGATITGSHAVAFGSEVDSGAVVTMSGNIDATGGNLILKNTTVAAKTTATLSGNITFEGKVQNSGTLAIADGSTINIDEESLIRNAHFVHNGNNSAKNGYLADNAVLLAEGGTYSYNEGQLTLHLDGEAPTVGKLELTQPEAGGSLSISGFKEMMMGTYFVREGEVTYTHIKGANDQVLKKIAIGNDGVLKDEEGKELNHMLVLDKAWTDENWSGQEKDKQVTIVSASDHAKVLLSDGVVLNASQTAIKGEANELHVTFDKAETAHGTGYVLLDDASKLSQLAGDATMKVTESTTVNSEAKMTGELNVASGDLTVTDEGSIASFKTVNLADNNKLAIETTHNDAIQSLSGSGTLSKTGEGTLAISGNSSDYEGSVNIGKGTLEVQNDMTAKTLSGSGKLVKTGEKTTLTVQNASGFTGDISVSDKAHVNLLGVREGVNVSLHELVIDNGTLGVYDGYTPGAGNNEANVGALTLAKGSRIVIGSSKDKNANVLEANLATLSGSILDFTSGGVLTMGCDLTVGEGTIVLLNESAYATLAEGGSVELFSGVDNKAMEASKVSVYLNTVGSADKMLAQVSFSSENGTVSVSVPEPATATLSLLALAGLAARRRRSKAVAA